MSLGPVVDVADRRLADAAYMYARAGWAVFPMRGTSKRPRTTHGSLDASCDPETVARWWRAHPQDNIAVRVPPSIVVADLDRHDGRTPCRWTPDDFAPSLTCRTGAGHHIWFAAPAVELRSTSTWPAWAGVELKRHDVVVPPSVHGATGNRYEWIRRAPIARLPAMIVDAFRRSEPLASSMSESPSDRYVAAARRGVLADLAEAAGPGSHHWPLLRAAGRYRALGLDVDRAVDELLPLVPGHDQREAERTVRWAFKP